MSNDNTTTVPDVAPIASSPIQPKEQDVAKSMCVLIFFILFSYYDASYTYSIVKFQHPASATSWQVNTDYFSYGVLSWESFYYVDQENYILESDRDYSIF
jgi:hypothetical protein